MNLNSLLIAITFTIFTYSAQAQTIKLDESFGNNGLVSSEPVFGFGASFDLQIQEDGSILSLSIIYDDLEESEYYSLEKYNPAGIKDENFAQNGEYKFSFGETEYPVAIDILQDEFIVLTSLAPSDSINILVLNSDGSLYTKNQYRFDQLLPNVEYYQALKVICNNDDIYIGGSSDYYDEEFTYIGNLFMLKMNKEGELNPNFGVDGVLLIQNESIIYEFSDLNLNNEELYLLNNKYDGGWENGKLTLSKFDTNGQKITAFGINGEITITFSEVSFGNIFIHNSRILVALPEYGAVFAFDAEGEIDLNYGVEGVALNSPQLEYEGIFSSMDNDGNIKIFASTGDIDDEDSESVIIGYTKYGESDLNLDNDGIYDIDLPGSEFIFNGETSKEGDLLICGASVDFENGTFRKLLARYNFTTINTDNTDLSKQIEVFPNPIVGNKISIKNNNAQSITNIDLLDESGKLIASLYSEINKNSELSFLLPSSLSTGTYLIKIKLEDSSITKKIVLTIH